MFCFHPGIFHLVLKFHLDYCEVEIFPPGIVSQGQIGNKVVQIGRQPCVTNTGKTRNMRRTRSPTTPLCSASKVGSGGFLQPILSDKSLIIETDEHSRVCSTLTRWMYTPRWERVLGGNVFQVENYSGWKISWVGTVQITLKNHTWISNVCFLWVESISQVEKNTARFYTWDLVFYPKQWCS